MTPRLPWAAASSWQSVALRRRYDVRLGRQLQNEQTGGADELVPYLKAAHVHWAGVKTTDLPTMWASPQDQLTYAVAPGDLIVCEGGDVGRSAVLGDDAPRSLIIQNAVHRVRASDERPLAYLAFVLRAMHGAGWLDVVCNRATIRHLTSDKLKALPIPDPPVDEQHRIVGTLSPKVAALESLVANVEVLITAVRQKKQRLCSVATSEGIRHTDRVDAGEDGLHRVPAGWDVKKLKWANRRVTVGIVNTPAAFYAEGGGVPALRGLNVRPGLVTKSDLVHLTEVGHVLHQKSELRSGDVVVVRTGAAGAAAVVPDWADGANAIDLLIIRQSDALVPKFLEHLINSDFASEQILKHSVGSLQAHFNVGSMKNLVVPVPPIDEQEEILSYLAPRVERIEALLANLSRLADLARECRHALILSAVTTGVGDA